MCESFCKILFEHTKVLMQCFYGHITQQVLAWAGSAPVQDSGQGAVQRASSKRRRRESRTKEGRGGTAVGQEWSRGQDRTGQDRAKDREEAAGRNQQESSRGGHRTGERGNKYSLRTDGPGERLAASARNGDRCRAQLARRSKALTGRK